MRVNSLSLAAKCKMHKSAVTYILKVGAVQVGSRKTRVDTQRLWFQRFEATMMSCIQTLLSISTCAPLRQGDLRSHRHAPQGGARLAQDTSASLSRTTYLWLECTCVSVCTERTLPPNPWWMSKQ